MRIGGTEKTSDVPHEGLRREIGLHFVTLDGLRYNHFDLLVMI